MVFIWIFTLIKIPRTQLHNGKVDKIFQMAANMQKLKCIKAFHVICHQYSVLNAINFLNIWRYSDFFQIILYIKLSHVNLKDIHSKLLKPIPSISIWWPISPITTKKTYLCIIFMSTFLLRFWLLFNIQGQMFLHRQVIYDQIYFKKSYFLKYFCSMWLLLKREEFGNPWILKYILIVLFLSTIEVIL